MSEQQFDRKALISQLAKSAHGSMEDYRKPCIEAAMTDPEFYAHLAAWNHVKGQIRDSKIALPVGALARLDHPAFAENALALLADLPPRLFEQGVMLFRDWKLPGHRTVRRLVERYLRDLEADRKAWDRTALQHRDTMRTLYGEYHVKPGTDYKIPRRTKRHGDLLVSREDVTVMKHQATTGKFAVVRDLPHLPALQIGALVKQHRLPFLVVRGALGPRAKEQDVALSLIEAMSPNELVTNTRALQRLGVQTDPVLRAAFEQAVGALGMKKPKRGAVTLKTTRAAEVLKETGDVVLSTKLHAAQERQLQQLGGIDGDWLVLGDRSPSMAKAIDVAMQICGILSRMVTGKVHLVLFDEGPRYYDMTGKTYEQIREQLKNVGLGSATSIGCGLQYIVEKNMQVDGIAIVSDGGHNWTPDFSTAYRQYYKKFDAEPTVYFYSVAGDMDRLTPECAAAKIQVETFNLRGAKIDYASLPNIVSTMRVSRYSLIDEIYATPLATLDGVLDRTKGVEVLRREKVTA